MTWVTSNTVMPSSNVEFAVDGSIATITFTRPQVRNALTWEMYDALLEGCERADADPALRVLIIRGAGGAFSAGTDISQFRDFATGDDGIAYERRLDAVIARVERLSKITVAAIDGACAGGGCAIALACDLRICTPRAQIGVPVARTLGNCLSAANTARLIDVVGVGRAKELLLTGRLLSGGEAVQAGFASALVSPEQLDAHVLALARDLATRATSTVMATKEIVQRIRAHRMPPAAEDVIAACYASEEFRMRVREFMHAKAREEAEPREEAGKGGGRGGPGGGAGP